jgi:hypothetical protein
MRTPIIFCHVDIRLPRFIVSRYPYFANVPTGNEFRDFGDKRGVAADDDGCLDYLGALPVALQQMAVP